VGQFHLIHVTTNSFLEISFQAPHNYIRSSLKGKGRKISPNYIIRLILKRTVVENFHYETVKWYKEFRYFRFAVPSICILNQKQRTVDVKKEHMKYCSVNTSGIKEFHR